MDGGVMPESVSNGTDTMSLHSECQLMLMDLYNVLFHIQGILLDIAAVVTVALENGMSHVTLAM